MSNSSYTVEAVLKANDSGFSNAFKNAQKSVSGLSSMAAKTGSMFKSVLGANLVSSALTSGISAISGGIRSMGTELNSSQKAWKTFEGNLQAFGRSSEQIAAAKSEMQDFATKTIYSASDMASTYSQLDAVGTKNVGSLVKAFGGLAASAENPTQAMKSLSTQATQMASKPKVAWMDFKIMMEQAPAGMAAVAKEMGMSTDELVAAVQDGKVNTEEFFDAMNRAGNSDAFQKMATEFKTVDQAIDGAKESLSNKLMPAFEHLNKFGIKAVNALSDALGKLNFDKLADGLGKFLDGINVEGIIAKVSGFISELVAKVRTFWSAFANTGAVTVFVGAIQSIAGAIGHVWESLTATEVLTTLGTVLGNIVKWLSQAATAVADFISGLDPSIVQGFTNVLVGGIAGLLAFSAGTKLVSTGMKGLDFIKSFNPFKLFKKNAEDSLDGTTNSVSRSKSTIAQLFSGLTNLIKGVGTSFKSIFDGIGKTLTGLGKTFEGFGKGVGAALKGLMQGLKGINPATLLSFGAAIGIAAVGIGAGIGIIVASLSLLAEHSAGVSVMIQALGTAFATVAAAIIGAFAQAIVTVSGVLPVVTSALANLAPLVVAVGVAIGATAPAITALGDAFTSILGTLPPIITALGSAISQIATAITPIVGIISSAFVQIVTVVSNAIVQIIQALAPFIPSITEMVVAVAPVLSQIVDAFNNLISQISPIIDSISNLFKTLGEQISNILDSAKGVITGFGDAVRNVLDGVAGIFDSMGNAALNAGKGVKQMAQGIKILVDLKLGDLVGTLAAVATGLAAIAGSGIASAGPGLQQAGTGLKLIATSAQTASVAMQTLPSVFSTLNSSVVSLPGVMTTAGSAMRTFASAVMTSFVGLAGSTASITTLQSRITTLSTSMMMAQAGASAMSAGFTVITGIVGALAGVIGSIPSQFTAITSSAAMATAAIMQLATSAPMVASGFANISSAATSSMSQLNSAVRSAMTQAVSTMRSSMQQMVSVVRQSATQMTQAGQQAGRGVSTGVTNGIRSGVGSATAATSSMVSAIRSTAMAGVGSMRYIGAMIGQGLAAGMYSALGAVTAAANALVAQAERAAQAKAKIHSPSRLFRDEVGLFIGQGVAVGIDQSTKFVTKAMNNMFDGIEQFNMQVNDMMSDNLAYNFDTGRYSSSVEMTYRKQDSEQAEIIKESLAVIKELASRDTVIKVDSREFARATGDDITDYQNGRQRLENLVWGIKDNV